MDEKIFEFMTKMYSEIKQQFDVVNKKLDEKSDKTDIIKLENDLVPKIEALFDGYKQTAEKLDHIEKQVSKQEEIILRRIK